MCKKLVTIIKRNNISTPQIMSRLQVNQDYIDIHIKQSNCISKWLKSSIYTERLLLNIFHTPVNDLFNVTYFFY